VGPARFNRSVELFCGFTPGNSGTLGAVISRWWSGWLVLALTLPGCAEPTPQGAGSAASDSLDVPRVSVDWPPTQTTHLTTVKQAMAWTRVTDGAPVPFLHIVGGLALSDGRWAIATLDGIAVFRANGELDWIANGIGDGPGEFRSIRGVWRQPGDSLVVSDPRLSRVTRFGPDGKVGSVQPLAGRNAEVIGVFSDGSYLAATGDGAGNRLTEGLQRLAWRLYQADQEGAEVAGFGVYSSLERILDLSESGVTVVPPLLPSDAWFIAAGENLLVADNATGEITIFGRRTHQAYRVLNFSARRDRPSRRLLADLLKRRLSATNPARRVSLRRVLTAAPSPAWLPAFGPVAISDCGYLWVGEYQAVPARTRLWHAITRMGRPLGTVELPGTSRVLWADAARLLLAEEDAMGVETPAVYSIYTDDVPDCAT
jgi:hypothetical protein